MASDVRDLARALAIETTLLGGWSMGGLVAQAVLAEYPGLVSHLVLIGTAPPGKNAHAPEPIFLRTRLQAPSTISTTRLVLFFEPRSESSRRAAGPSHARIALRTLRSEPSLLRLGVGTGSIAPAPSSPPTSAVRASCSRRRRCRSTGHLGRPRHRVSGRELVRPHATLAHGSARGLPVRRTRAPTPVHRRSGRLHRTVRCLDELSAAPRTKKKPHVTGRRASPVLLPTRASIERRRRPVAPIGHARRCLQPKKAAKFHRVLMFMLPWNSRGAPGTARRLFLQFLPVAEVILPSGSALKIVHSSE